MDAEKIFHPNKWFVLFCGLLVVVWIALQSVVNMRITEAARTCGRDIFTWSWKAMNIDSRADITGTKVMRRSQTDAVVEIKGRQTLSSLADQRQSQLSGNGSEVVDCGAILTFYKSSNNWQLGKVELK